VRTRNLGFFPGDSDALASLNISQLESIHTGNEKLGKHKNTLNSGTKLDSKELKSAS
jgi:hypothetical protein